MENPPPQSTARIFGHPLHPMLIPFPMVSFIGAFAADIAYWRSANLFWLNMASWLLAAGLLFGALAAATGLTDYLANKRIRALRPATPHMLLNIAVMVIGLVNVLVHNRDGWTAVVPTGLILSTITVLLLGVSAWLGGSLVYKHGVGVRP